MPCLLDCIHPVSVEGPLGRSVPFLGDELSPVLGIWKDWVPTQVPRCPWAVEYLVPSSGPASGHATVGFPGSCAPTVGLSGPAAPVPAPGCLRLVPPGLQPSPLSLIVCVVKAANPGKRSRPWAAASGPPLLLPGAHLYAEGIRGNLSWPHPGELLAP